MKAHITDKTGKSGRQIELPENFSSAIRADIMLKVFEAQKRKQAFGNYEDAGELYSAMGILRRKRHAWKVTYGKGISRTPRKIMSRDGASFNWVGATAPNTRGGRRAHPPKSEENQFRKINKKELLYAMNSALSATADSKSLEKKYGKRISAELPVVFSDEVLKLKTKQFLKIIEGIFADCHFLKEKRVRAGRGKSRGRKYKSNAGLLFVVADDESMKRSGIDVVRVSDLKIRDLAPNGLPGRFAAYTEKAIKQIGEKFR